MEANATLFVSSRQETSSLLLDYLTDRFPGFNNKIDIIVIENITDVNVIRNLYDESVPMLMLTSGDMFINNDIIPEITNELSRQYEISRSNKYGSQLHKRNEQNGVVEEVGAQQRENYHPTRKEENRRQSASSRRTEHSINISSVPQGEGLNTTLPSISSTARVDTANIDPGAFLAKRDAAVEELKRNLAKNPVVDDGQYARIKPLRTINRSGGGKRRPGRSRGGSHGVRRMNGGHNDTEVR